jgi:hypothetical protein
MVFIARIVSINSMSCTIYLEFLRLMRKNKINLEIKNSLSKALVLVLSTLNKIINISIIDKLFGLLIFYSTI